jgi:hypothetical protein
MDEKQQQSTGGWQKQELLPADSSICSKTKPLLPMLTK